MSFYTKQETVVSDSKNFFDNKVNLILYNKRNELDLKITYSTIMNNLRNDEPIHIAYITWKEKAELE